MVVYRTTVWGGRLESFARSSGIGRADKYVNVRRSSKLGFGLIDEPRIKLGSTRDHHDVFCFRMQPEGNFQRRMELALHKHARRGRRQHERVEFSLVNAAEDDRRSGEDILADRH
jgi:hypothetical protein